MKHKVGDMIGWKPFSNDPIRGPVGKIHKITEAGNYIIYTPNGLNRERVGRKSVVVNFTTVFDELCLI